jgi:hypothetical protein
MSNWADERARRCTTDEEIAVALRQAKAAGVRYGAEYFVILDPDTLGPWAYNLRAQADRIEKGET